MNGLEHTHTAFSAAHLIYIPLCIFAGVVLGWILGARSSREEISRLQDMLDDSERAATERRLEGRRER